LALVRCSLFDRAISDCEQVEILQNAAETFELCAGRTVLRPYERQALIRAGETYNDGE
jgi:hypothetical protein